MDDLGRVMEALRTISGWLNPLDPLYDALAEKINFPVDQVNMK